MTNANVMTAHYVMGYDRKRGNDTGTLTLAQYGAHTLQVVAKWENVTLPEVIELRNGIIADAALNDVDATCEIQVGI